VKERAEELLIERAVRPLDDGELAELDQLGAAQDSTYDVSAAAIAIATTPLEQMPQHVTDRLLAAAPRPDFTRTIPGVIANPIQAHDTIVGVDLQQFAPPQHQPQPHDELAARREQKHPKPRSTMLPWMAAAAMLLVASGAVWLALRKDQPIAPADARAELLGKPGAAKLAWTATADPNAHGASGDVVWSQAEQRGYMRFVGLAPNDPAQFQYQLWIFDKDRDEKFPVDGGVFDVSSSGEVIVPISAKLRVSDATLFAVTIEKPGGVVVSKRERIVVTATRS